MTNGDGVKISAAAAVLRRLLRNRTQAIPEQGKVTILRLVRKQRLRDRPFHLGLSRREKRQHPAHLRLADTETAPELDEIGGRIEAEFLVAGREMSVGEEIERGRGRIVRKVNRRIQQVIRRRQNVIALRTLKSSRNINRSNRPIRARLQ